MNETQTVCKHPMRSKRELKDAGGVFNGSTGHEVVIMPDGSEYVRAHRQDLHPDMFSIWKAGYIKSTIVTGGRS